MSTQKALIVTSVGKSLTETIWPIPRPGPRQIQLRVVVAGLNPHDQKCRDYGVFIRDWLPASLASDVAGVVTALGPEVTKFKVGDRVFTYGNIFGGQSQKGLQQYSIADEDFAAKIPEGFNEHDVATLPVNTAASVVGLFDHDTLNIPAPWTKAAKTFDFAGIQLLIIGGGSNCGKFAVQLAKLAGIGKIVVLGGKEEELMKFGATHVLDRHESDVVIQQRIRNIVGDDLLYCLDTVNLPDNQYVGINALSNTKKGTMARLVPMSPVDISHILPKQAGYEVANVMGLPHLKPITKPFYDRIEEYLVQGKIVPLSYAVEQGLDAAKVNEVLDKYRDGKPVIQTHFRISN